MSETPVTRISFSFPAEPASIGEVRRLVVTEARTLPFTDEELDDIALAVSEAFTNLVQHAPGHRIRGVCEVSDTALEVRFEAEPTLSPFIDKRQLPPGTAHSGRGIPLLHMLIPTVEVRERADGTSELRLVKPVTHPKEGRG
jgi:anti-sigma regulatory factor (Ser/Thr protein kinase)